MITIVATVLLEIPTVILGNFSKGAFTALLPSEAVILVYKDLISRDKFLG